MVRPTSSRDKAAQLERASADDTVIPTSAAPSSSPLAAQAQAQAAAPGEKYSHITSRIDGGLRSLKNWAAARRLSGKGSDTKEPQEDEPLPASVTVQRGLPKPRDSTVL